MHFQFSNFHPLDKPLIYQGLEFLTVENFYQAMKAEKDDLTTRRRISSLPPSQAKKMGRRIKLRFSCSGIKLKVMEYALRHKFAPTTSWANKLLKTGHAEIIEWNSWHDQFWGKCRCDKCQGQGENHLGRQLMSIRDELVKQNLTSRQKTPHHIINLAQVLREYPTSDKARLAEILSEYPKANSNDACSILNTRFGLGKWLYCGWANRRLGLNTSPLANPYSCRPNARSERIRVESRNEAVERYRHWLWAQIKGENVAVIEALINVKADTTLVCWCAPKRCHCEVISRAATWLNTLPQDSKP